MKKIFYRVCNSETQQGLWYSFDGSWTGLIHDKFNFCKNNKLQMDPDPELVGWLSATDSLESLFQWFPEEDIKALQKFNYFIHVYESSHFRFYEKFSHLVINQNQSKLVNVIKL